MRAAERLFAERGSHDVSLREVAAAAGQGNHSAVLYHFKDKRGLIDAILERHSAPIQEGWLRALRAEPPAGAAAIPRLLRLLVEPIVAKLDDSDGGRAYLLLCAELSLSRELPLTETRVAKGEGAMEMGRQLSLFAGGGPPALLLLRMMRLVHVLYGSVVEYDRLRGHGLAIDRGEFVADLVAALAALLGGAAQTRAPASRSAAKRPARARRPRPA